MQRRQISRGTPPQTPRLAKMHRLSDAVKVVGWRVRHSSATGGSELRIWDLRRGDDDDDRTNPHGRGLRSLVFSAALEFNYLKAPIGFLALFVAPALLIGIAPSVVIAYARLILHAPALAGGSLIVTPVVFLVLAAVAFWIGRPLVDSGVEQFLASPLQPRAADLRRVARIVARGGGKISRPVDDRSNSSISAAGCAL